VLLLRHQRRLLACCIPARAERPGWTSRAITPVIRPYPPEWRRHSSKDKTSAVRCRPQILTCSTHTSAGENKTKKTHKHLEVLLVGEDSYLVNTVGAGEGRCLFFLHIIGQLIADGSCWDGRRDADLGRLRDFHRRSSESRQCQSQGSKGNNAFRYANDFLRQVN
jgi:hypothetical protein